MLGIIFCVLGVMLFIRTEVLFFLCGVGIIVYGISRLIEWGRRRKTGTSERWALIGGIAAIAVGLAAFVGGNLGEVAVYIVILIISIWISVAGVIEVLGFVLEGVRGPDEHDGDGPADDIVPIRSRIRVALHLQSGQALVFVIDLDFDHWLRR